jgi:hypothetical protein
MPEDKPEVLFPQLNPIICPKCGAPLPPADKDGFVTCSFCGVRSHSADLAPTRDEPIIPNRYAETDRDADTMPDDDIFDSDENDYGGSSGGAIRWLRLVVSVVVFVIMIAIFASSYQSQSSPSVGDYCSASIVASPSAGYAPVTVYFNASVTGGTDDSPSWEFGPNFSFENMTWGWSVEYTFTSPGSYGVHLSVADQDGPGCSADTVYTVLP